MNTWLSTDVRYMAALIRTARLCVPLPVLVQMRPSHEVSVSANSSDRGMDACEVNVDEEESAGAR
jgi:hypothetical protein